MRRLGVSTCTASIFFPVETITEHHTFRRGRGRRGGSMSTRLGAPGDPRASATPTRQPLLFFSTRQGRQTNCVLTVEVARLVAERIGRRLVVPWCHTSPYGPQACSARQDIPSQRQVVLPFLLTKMLQPRDLARCSAAVPGTPHPPVLEPMDMPLTTWARPVTCLSVTPRGQKPARIHGERSPCAKELSGDDELRSQLTFRFVRTVSVTPDQLRDFHNDKEPSSLALLPPGEDVYLAEAFALFANEAFGPFFGLCELPRPTDEVVRMERQLERALGFARNETLCVHWRGEDFHHPTKLVRWRTSSTLGADEVANRWIKPLAQRVSARNVLLLTNVRHETLEGLVEKLRAAGLRAASPRHLNDTAFGCDTGFVYATIAEQLACSRARTFLGSHHSSFSSHIVAMRRSARGGMRMAAGVTGAGAAAMPKPAGGERHASAEYWMGDPRGSRRR